MRTAGDLPVAQAGAGKADGVHGLALPEVDSQPLGAGRCADPALAYIEPKAGNDFDAPAKTKPHVYPPRVCAKLWLALSVVGLYTVSSCPVPLSDAESFEAVR